MDKMFESGRFVTGCNYWASHAGTAMWSDWNEEVVRKDFTAMAEAGLQLVRIFPLWPDFQPLKQHYTGHVKPRELRLGEHPLPNTEAGRAGVSEEAISKFRIVADIAEEHGIKLSIGLITGWMSGRLFVPPAFERLNCLTDPMVIRWQVMFVKYFVKTFKDHKAIVAWGPGNECNCLGPLENHDQAWIWMNTICSAIRSEDPTRPVISGMHSITPGVRNENEAPVWTIHDQGELSDMLTTHPYPKFTPYAGMDPINRMKNAFHATAQSRYYADISGKPCIAEELGTLCAMMAGEEVKAGYIRNTMFNLWSHDCHGLIWWCGFDQLHLEHTPYDWTAIERELGLFKEGHNPKPVVAELHRFKDFIASLPFEKLPEFKREAVCILSREQDTWANAWGSFMLAKQAGFDIEFQYSADELKDSDLYIVPGISGATSFRRNEWLNLLEKVQAGATLYLSLNDGVLAPFNQVFGVEDQYQQHIPKTVEFSFADCEMTVNTSCYNTLKATTAEVLIADSEGNPLFTCGKLGKGTVYLLNVPVERHLSQTPGSFHGATAKPYFELYKLFAGPWLEKRLVKSANPSVTITEHKLDSGKTVITAVNNQPETADSLLEIKGDVTEMLYGDTLETIGGNNAVVFIIQ